MIKKTRPFFVIVLFVAALTAEVQAQRTITLERAIQIACENSNQSSIARNEYKIAYWNFKAYRTNVLPRLDFKSQPVVFNRKVTKRYDSETNLDVYRPSEILNSTFFLAARQKIALTGGTLFVDSDFGRLLNFQNINRVDTVLKFYTATPFRIGFSQPILSYNALSWDKKISPLNFKKSRLDYLLNQQVVALETVRLFFDLAIAYQKLEILERTKESSERLFKLGTEKYKLGTLSSENLSLLELATHRADVNHSRQKIAILKSSNSFNLLIGAGLEDQLLPKTPDNVIEMEIDKEDVVQKAKQVYPDIMSFEIKELEASRELDKIVKDRFKLSVVASYGINNQSSSANDLFRNTLDQQQISVNFSIPIVDWGERRDKVKVARINREIVQQKKYQETQKFEQKLAELVFDFNQQQRIIHKTRLSFELGKKSYELSEKRFLSGLIDAWQLQSAADMYQATAEDHMRSVKDYWVLYYEIRKYTLYDYMLNQSLETNFDQIIDEG